MRRLWPWLFAGLFLGGIVHIASILAMPIISERDATTRLRAAGPINIVSVLPRSRPGTGPFPFLDPSIALAICPYDLKDGPLRIKVSPGEQYVTVAFLKGGGSIFYALSDKANPNGALDMRLANTRQLARIEADDPEDQSVTELRITSASDTGVVLIRALALQASGLDAAERRLAGATCAVEPLP